MHSVAGVCAYAASCTLHPLENIKLRFAASDLAKNNPIPQYNSIYHALSSMYKHEGFGALYRGVLINLIAGSFANSIFFYVYADGKKRYNFDAENPNSWTTVWISLRAGVCAMTLTTPFWVVKTRLALYKQKDKS